MVTIRPAELRDLNRLKEIEDLVFKRQGINETRATIRNRILVFPKGCFVAIERGAIVGYALSERRGRITKFALNGDVRRRHAAHGPYLYLAGLAVHPSFQGKSIGAMLLKKVVGLAMREKYQAILLSTWYARGYYPKFGFKIYRKVYGKNGKLNYYIFARQLR